MERLLKYFVPERYQLDIKIDKYAKTIGGRVKIYGVVKADAVKLHAVDLVIDEVLVDGKKADFNVTDGVLTIFKVPRNASCIEVGYHGSLNENMEGAYLSTYEYEGRTEVIVATQFESHYAREAFPCIDEPAAKAVFELSITTDAGDMVLSNTSELNGEPEDTPFSGRGSSLPSSWGSDPSCLGRNLRKPSNGASSNSSSRYRKVTFEPTPRMSTYLLAWVVGKFHGQTIKNEHGVEITTYCALNQPVETVNFANQVAARSLEFYDENFAVPYPLKKLTQVALPDFEAGAMENWGLVTYRESMLLVADSAALDVKKSVALTVAHELAHQWFGDLVTMEWWDDLWLNESFASVMEYYAVDAIYPEYKIWEGFFTGDALAALRRDCLTGVQPVHQDVNDPAEIATLFDPAIVYSKGARLMLMMIRLIGWDGFCKGVQEYFETHQYNNARGDDLWTALNPHAKFDVGGMMHAFIERPGYPVVKNEGVDFDQISQRRFLVDGKMEKSDWPLPEIREDMSGHYILDLSDAEFEERLLCFDGMNLEEKLRLLIDRDLLARTELVSSASLIPLLKKFNHENSAAVWNIILTIVSGLKVFFDYGSAEEKKFKEMVGELVKLKLGEIGIRTRENDDENTVRLRAVLLALDFYAENRENLQELAKMYDADYATIDAEIRDDVLTAKIYLEPEMLDEYLANYKKIADPEIKFELLMAATVSKDEVTLVRMMELLNQPEVVKPQDQFYLFLYLYRNSVVRERVFLWLTENWDFVRGLAGDKSLENYPRYTASAVRTEKEFAMWWEFFGPMSDDPALARAIEVGKNEIKARLKLIGEDGPEVVKVVQDLPI